MSNPITLLATEPVRSLPERPRGTAGATELVGGQKVKGAEKPTPTISETPEPVDAEAPEIKEAVETIRNFVTDMQRELQFSVDEDSGRTIITVIDSDSGKIIRQIPPEEILQIAKSVAGGGNLNLIDSRA